MVTDVELLRLVKEIKEVAHYIPSSEQWRIKSLVLVVSAAVKRLKALEEELRVARAGR